MGGAGRRHVPLDVGGWADALAPGLQGVQSRGKAQAGDKTMLDALLPAVEALRAAQAAARDGRRATTPPRRPKKR